MIKTSLKIFVFIFSAIFFFTACEKSNLNDVSENQVYDNTEQRILEFKTKVDNKSKSSEEITIEDAVWLTEALANYQYCKITDEKQQADLNAISIDSVFIDISVNNNSTTISETVNAYSEIEQTITSSFNKFDYEIKFYDLVDVEFLNNQLRVYYAFAYNLDCESKTDCYSLNQDWSFGMDFGKCDGTCVGKDATDILYTHVNLYVAFPGNQYFTDVHNFGWTRPDATDNYGEYLFETNDNPYGDYLMFIKDIPNFQTYSCIPANEMNYYVTGTHQALNIMQDMIPTGYNFKSWKLTSFHGGSEMFGYQDGHSLDVWYGIGHNISPAN